MRTSGFLRLTGSNGGLALASVRHLGQAIRQKGRSMTTYKVGYFVGSLSSTSINRELSKALIRLAPAIWSSPRSRSGICRCTARTTTPISRRRPGR